MRPVIVAFRPRRRHFPDNCWTEQKNEKRGQLEKEKEKKALQTPSQARIYFPPSDLVSVILP